MKTTITLTPDQENNWNVHVQVIVADHALVDFTSYGISGGEDEARARFTKCIPDYETIAKAKALAIFKELIA